MATNPTPISAAGRTSIHAMTASAEGDDGFELASFAAACSSLPALIAWSTELFESNFPPSKSSSGMIDASGTVTVVSLVANVVAVWATVVVVVAGAAGALRSGASDSNGFSNT